MSADTPAAATTAPEAATSPAALTTLSSRFLLEHPGEAANRLEQLDPAAVADFAANCSDDLLEPLFARLSPDFAAALLSRLPEPRQLEAMRRVDPRYGGLILGQLEEETRNALLGKLPRGAARALRAMMSYEPNSAGALMEPRVTALREDMDIADARRRIASGRRATELRYYATDAENRPTLRMNARELLISPESARISDIGRPVATTVTSDLPKEDVTRIMQDTGLAELPVVDAEGRLIGVISHQTLVGALREEAIADIQKMVGVSKDERALSPAFFAVKKRLPWLEINLLTAFLAATVVGAFESTIAKYTALAVLLPVVAGQSGNAGAQALAVTIRGLALREIGPRQWFAMFRKEAMVGLVNGVAIAITTGVAVFIWSQSWGLAGVIFLSMIISMLIAGVAGALTPIMLAKLGQDPAQSSSIVLTTITDIAGFMSFLGIATALAAYLPTG